MVLLAMSLLGVGVGVCLPVAQANAPAPVRAAAAGLRSLAGGFKAGGGRFLDTRVGTGAPKGAVGPGKSITVQTYASDPVAINLTVTGATGAGYLTAYASGGPRPTVSNLNFVAGQTVANLAIVPAGSDGNIVLFNGSSGTVQIIGDYGGSYPIGAAPTENGAFQVVAPTRILDTRAGTGAPKLPVGAFKTLSVQVDGRAGVPAHGVRAVAINLTVTRSAAAGYLTAFADGATRPTVSNVNFAAGRTVPTLATVPVGADGKIALYNGSAGTAQLIGDVAGYYLGTSGVSELAGGFTPVAPTRILDTRIGLGAPKKAVGPQGSVYVLVDGSNGIPAPPFGSSAVLLDVTATAPTGSGYLAPGQGSGSSLNFTPGQTVSNLVVVSTFDAGYVPFFNGSPNGSVQIVADIVGYYAGDPGLPWTLPQKIDAANALTSVSCAVPVSAIKCVAVDNLGNALISSAVDATAKWTKQAKIDRVGLTSVACATKFCIALDVSGRATVFNGTSWSAPSAVAIAKEALRRVSCAPTSCIATGATTAVQYSVSTWKAPVILDPAHHLQNVSCLSATFCLAVDGSAGADGKSFQFNGTTWSKPTPIVSGGKVGTVACDIPYSEGPDLAFCVAGDTSGNGFRYDGRTWVEQKAVNPDEGGIRFLACSRDPYTLCFAGGFHSSTVALYDEPNVGRFFRGGWVPATIIEPAPSGLQDMSCVSVFDCVAINQITGSVLYGVSPA